MQGSELLWTRDESPKDRRVQRDPQCLVGWVSFKLDTSDPSRLQPSCRCLASPLAAPGPRHRVHGAPSPRADLSARIYCHVESNDTPSVLLAILLKHTALAQVNYRPATEITGCSSLAWVKRMIDPGIAELPPEPEKPWIALGSLRLCTVMQNLLSFFSVPFVYYPNGSAFTGSGSWIAERSHDCVFSGLSF